MANLPPNKNPNPSFNINPYEDLVYSPSSDVARFLDEPERHIYDFNSLNPPPLMAEPISHSAPHMAGPSEPIQPRWVIPNLYAPQPTATQIPLIPQIQQIPEVTQIHQEVGQSRLNAPMGGLEGQSSGQRGGDPRRPPPQNANVGNHDDTPLPLNFWPFPPTPFTCSCCSVLREINHTNGTQNTRFEIHGRVGVISHGILEVGFVLIDEVSTPKQYYMVDFSRKSMDTVRRYLENYCEDRERAGFFLVEDPLLPFYDALCVGLNFEDLVNANLNLGGQPPDDEPPPPHPFPPPPQFHLGQQPSQPAAPGQPSRPQPGLGQTIQGEAGSSRQALKPNRGVGSKDKGKGKVT